MKRILTALVLALGSATAACEWHFGPATDLTDTLAAPHFHHLDGAGRRHVATTAAGVAVIWEDDSSGEPQVYITTRSHGAPGFEPRMRLSAGAEAYEPAVVGLGPERWLAAWEQDGDIHVRALGASGPGPTLELAAAGARQVTLASRADGLIAVAWAQDARRGQVLRAALLETTGSTPRIVRQLDVPQIGRAHV